MPGITCSKNEIKIYFYFFGSLLYAELFLNENVGCLAVMIDMQQVLYEGGQ